MCPGDKMKSQAKCSSLAIILLDYTIHFAKEIITCVFLALWRLGRQDEWVARDTPHMWLTAPITRYISWLYIYICAGVGLNNYSLKLALHSLTHTLRLRRIHISAPESVSENSLTMWYATHKSFVSCTIFCFLDSEYEYTHPLISQGIVWDIFFHIDKQHYICLNL